MKRYFLDTSVIINYLRGVKETIEYLNLLDGEFTSSSICLAELFEGVYRVKEKEATKKIVLQFFSSLSTTFGIDEDIAESFGKLRAQLKQRGAILEDIDILIAATCLVNDLVLVTQNTKHFSRVKGLLLG